MLTKKIDGKEVICSEEEEKNIRAYWALNNTYPEYQGHCGFDGENPPFHDMNECRNHHKNLIEKSYELAKSQFDKEIEMAQEDANESLVKDLFAKRKAIRRCLDMDFSGCKTVDDLRSSIPEILKPYWNK